MKNDARVRYTRMRIREAFFECLKEKSVNRITVKEICDRAEINRATFYKHYADPFELLQKLEEEALEELLRRIQESRQEKAKSLLQTILDSMKDTGNPYGLLGSTNGDPGFGAQISNLFYREFQPQMARSLPCCTEAEKQAAYLFVAGGSGHLISAWIKDGMRAPAEQVAAELGQICSVFVRAYGRRDAGCPGMGRD